MAHLKCALHERRVLVTEGKAVHRSTQAGELSPKCGTKIVLIAGNRYPVSNKTFRATPTT